MQPTPLHFYLFCKEVVALRCVWTIIQDDMIPTFPDDESGEVMVFWSTAERAAAFLAKVGKSTNFELLEIEWEDFRDQWLQEIRAEGMEVGVNWTGDNLECQATAEEIIAEIEARM
jgi:hypothetical protein